MATLARRASHREAIRFDDEDDDGPYDKRYPGRRIVADGGRVRVPILLTDSMPPDYRAAISRDRAQLYDARYYYPPRTYVGDSAALRDAERAAKEARDAWVRGLQDAWKQPSGKMMEPPDNSDPDGDEDDDDPDAVAEASRQAYINRISNGWRTPMASPYTSEANAVQAAFIRTAGGGPGPAKAGGEADAIAAARQGRRPGTAGVTFGAHNPSAFPSRDSAALKDARRDADQAYASYCDRIANAWRKG